MKKLGLIVNPIAGMGGRVGLKGTDGADVLSRARELGAQPEATRRAVEALAVIAGAGEPPEVVAYPHEMGEDEAREAGFAPTVVGSISSGETTAADTRRAAREMESLGVDLILFAGGDGTARDVYDAVALRVPTLGVPAGVKIHSAVFAITPRDAGNAATVFLSEDSDLREAEVMDTDEEAFRGGEVQARLYGYLRVPQQAGLMQDTKLGGLSEEESLAGMAAAVAGKMHPARLYVFGPGTTTGAIMRELGLDHTLLGVDVVENGHVSARDANEAQLLEMVRDREATVVVSPIGGQGYILGRGNQQISPAVIRAVGVENVMVVATREKLASLGQHPLLVDTGDAQLDQAFSGYIKVVTGVNESFVRRVGMRLVGT